MEPDTAHSMARFESPVSTRRHLRWQCLPGQTLAANILAFTRPFELWSAERAEMTLTPLDQFEGSLAERTYQSLRQAILDVTYRPGAPMPKRVICEELGVSRSPVSEAIARLASDGLVRVVPQAGTFVALFSMAEIREGAFLREAIELAAVEHLASRIDDAGLATLRRILRLQDVMVAESDGAGFYDLDRQFHAAILSLTGFPKLNRVSETAWIHVDRARQQMLPVEGRIDTALEEHRAIYRALEEHDAEAARAAMRHHLRQLIVLLEPLERDRPDLFSQEPESNE